MNCGEFMNAGMVPLFLGVLDDVVSFFLGFEELVDVGGLAHR